MGHQAHEATRQTPRAGDLHRALKTIVPATFPANLLAELWQHMDKSVPSRTG